MFNINVMVSTRSGLTPVPLVSWIRDRMYQVAIRLRRLYLVRFWHMDIGEGTRISYSAKLDKTNPRGVHIGSHTMVAFGAAILTHDFINDRYCDVRIGDNCMIGARAIIIPGVTIGSGSIISAASVVMRDVPPGSLVVGNPARVVESGIVTGPWGIRRHAAT